MSAKRPSRSPVKGRPAKPSAGTPRRKRTQRGKLHALTKKERQESLNRQKQKRNLMNKRRERAEKMTLNELKEGLKANTDYLKTLFNWKKLVDKDSKTIRFTKLRDAINCGSIFLDEIVKKKGKNPEDIKNIAEIPETIKSLIGQAKKSKSTVYGEILMSLETDLTRAMNHEIRKKSGLESKIQRETFDKTNKQVATIQENIKWFKRELNRLTAELSRVKK